MRCVVDRGYSASNRRFLNAAGVEHDTHTATLLCLDDASEYARLFVCARTNACPGKFLRNLARTCPALPCAIVT